MSSAQCRKTGHGGKATRATVSQMVLSRHCGDDRFGLLNELRLAGRSAIKWRRTEVPLQRVDCITDGGRDAPQSFSLWQ
jgi:hypothetical protein